jgi:hypothetical protein
VMFVMLFSIFQLLHLCSVSLSLPTNRCQLPIKSLTLSRTSKSYYHYNRRSVLGTRAFDKEDFDETDKNNAKLDAKEMEQLLREGAYAVLLGALLISFVHTSFLHLLALPGITFNS